MIRRKDIIAVFILILVIIIRFAPFVFCSTPINPDSWKSYDPWKSDHNPLDVKTTIKDIHLEYDVWFRIVKEEISKGNFPHWNQYSFCGTPLYANHLVPVFHIPLALALLWQPDLIVTAYSFIMAIIGTMFFYWFLRNWGFRVFIALFGSLAFFLSGFQQFCVPPEIATFIWVPAILLFHDRFLETNRLRDACWGAFFTGQFLIAGYPISMAHFVYFMIAYVLWRRFHPDFKWKAPVRRWITALVIIVVAGGLISAVQNYPAYEYMKLSNRTISSEKGQLKSIGTIISNKHEDSRDSKSSTDIKSLFFYQLWKKSMLITPTLERNMFLNRAFVGPVVILLALIALFAAHGRYMILKIFFVVFCIFYLITPVYSTVAKYMPGWSISYLVPLEVLAFLWFFLAVLGLDLILKLKKRKILISILTVFVIVLQLVLLSPLPTDTGLAQVDVFRWSASTDFYAQLVYLLTSSLILVFVGARSLGRIYPKFMKYSLLVLFAGSGLLANFFIFPCFSHQTPMSENDEIRKIAEGCRDGRIVRYCRMNYEKTNYPRHCYYLPANLPARFKIMDVFGYDSMMMGNYDDFFNTAAPGTVIMGRFISSLRDIDQLKVSGFLIESCGIKYCLTKSEPGFKELFGLPVYDDSLQIYQVNPHQNAYARFISQYSLVDEYEGDLLEDDFSNNVLLAHKPFLPDGNILESTVPAVDSRSIKINRNNNTLEVNFNAPRDCILYIADTYHPRWRAKIDDREVDITEANLAFRAVVVPSGKHTLYMWYDGIEVLIGGLISIAGILMLILILISDREKTTTVL